MKRRTLLQKVAVFPEGGEADVMVDNLKLCLSPFSLGARKKAAVCRYTEIKNAQQLGVGYSADVTIERTPRVVMQWTRGDIVVQQRVGATHAADMSGLSQTVDLNVNRLVRRSLGPDGARFPQPAEGTDNFVDPRLLSGREARAVGLSLLFITLEDCITEYCAVLQHVFGVTLRETEVRVSLNEVELAWDRLAICIAEAAHHAYWRPWRRHPVPSRSSSGLLGRSIAKGESVKLYPKTRDVLRYEAQLSGPRKAAMLGRALNLRDRTAVDRAITTLGEHYYTHIREVQADLLNPELAPLSEVLGLAWPARLASEHRGVFESLLATGSVKCRSQSSYRLLRVLRSRGLVALSKTKGVWVTTRALDATLGALNTYLVATGERWSNA